MILTPRCLWLSFLRDRWHQIVLHRRSGGMLVDLIVVALGCAGVRTSWSKHRILCDFSTMNRILLCNNVARSMFRDAHRGGEEGAVTFRLTHKRLGRVVGWTLARSFLDVLTISPSFSCSYVQLVHETKFSRHELYLGRRLRAKLAHSTPSNFKTKRRYGRQAVQLYRKRKQQKSVVPRTGQEAI
ncbi:hypothetical protein PMIN01_11097 [Paraphaeosphaeria minitans]|uniref:Uncharacterized protein n=1 Tax=Paraphaeosphaeria minitans TaxID=565426 RepID=A0A9P6KL44_9PLEO|nr:hypothetical protein PMIN01_11097 [Paraphaeosphaeria minitans]